MKIAPALLLIATVVAPAFAAGPTWDSSGNGQLNGNYYFRQVLYQADDAGNASGFYAYYGNIAFNGTGAYTISNATFLSDTSSGFSSTSAPTTGTYSVSASGYGFLASPLVAGQNLIFMVSNHILIGSETESGDNDLFIAAPVSSLSNGSFTGSYTMSAFFPGVSAAGSAGATFQLNPNGAGSLGTVSVSGYSGAGSTEAQNYAGVKYAFSNGANVISFPTNSNALFYSGQEFMYLSSDSNFVFGGSPNGFDMFVGVRNASGGATALSGLYYESGLEENEVTGIDSFYGSFNATGGNLIGHERILYSASTAIGLTYSASYPTNIGGTYSDQSNTVNYTIGQDGIRISYGTGGYLGLGVALPYTPPAPTGNVYIDPTGVVNTASSAPYTAGISPGDFLTLYNGVNLANVPGLVVESGAPIPSILSGVKVLVDGLPAPIFYVSATQISFLVPYEVNATAFPIGTNPFPVATIQVSNNGVLSNIVTTPINQTTPGVFSSNSGIGVAAMLDFPSSGGYFVVSEDNPAQAGDTVALYLTGLGAPFPSNQDGAEGPSSGDILVQTINVDVNGTDVGTPAYSGLAPALAGLYQINFTIPAATVSGDNPLGITGPDSYSKESVIPIGTGSNASARASAETAPSVHRRIVPRLSKTASR